MFLQNVAAIPPTLRPLEQGASSVQRRAAILIKIFCWFRKPLERRKELHPFVQKGCGSYMGGPLLTPSHHYFHTQSATVDCDVKELFIAFLFDSEPRLQRHLPTTFVTNYKTSVSEFYGFQNNHTIGFILLSCSVAGLFSLKTRESFVGNPMKSIIRSKWSSEKYDTFGHVSFSKCNRTL
ncbi:hypothetical protein AVEN_9684-1 [Araneus ventricosus]|uniref:Uncharacterized protein n=1 Tax=Araneus ventricosus TaxID=182803 RepID=A0A4Y2DVV0_ARAVE|nr:hypothetical protein AVEN_9684-1 [Araneus ventricosus]